MPTPQELYNELNKRGAFQKDAQAAAIGHELRRRGLVHDPTQGGAAKPQAAKSQPEEAATPANFFKDLIGANGKRGEIHQGLIDLIGANPKQKHGLIYQGAASAGKALSDLAGPLIPGNDNPFALSAGNRAIDNTAEGVLGGALNDPFVKNAGRAVTGKPTRLGKDIMEHKFQTLADILPGMGAAGHGLGLAGHLAESAGASRLAGGLAKGAEAARNVATLGPVGRAAAKLPGKAAQALRRHPSAGGPQVKSLADYSSNTPSGKALTSTALKKAAKSAPLETSPIGDVSPPTSSSPPSIPSVMDGLLTAETEARARLKQRAAPAEPLQAQPAPAPQIETTPKVITPFNPPRVSREGTNVVPVAPPPMPTPPLPGETVPPVMAAPPIPGESPVIPPVEVPQALPPADWMHPSQATPDMAPELKNAVNHGLNQTNGFGTYTLTDGTEVHPNVISRLIDHHGNLVDPETIAQVTDHNGKLLYVKPPPEVSAPPVAPVAPGSVPTGLIPDFPVDQLRTDPERFQYKLGSGQGGESTGDHASLAGGEPGGLFPPENGSAPEGGAAGPDGGAVHEKPAVTERLDAADHAAQARIKARAKGRVSSGVDPADIADLTIVGAAKLGKGVITFRDWSKEMLGEFGEDLRPHLSALYAAAHDHVQALTDTGAEPLPHMAAVQAARAPAEGSDAPGQHGKTKKPQASYAGSINLGNLTTTPQAKALIQAASEKIGRGDPLTHDEIRTAAKALHLTHEMLAQITPGEVPSGVHPAIFQKKVRDMHVADAESAEQAVAAHTANPTPETEKAVEAANAKLLSIGEHAQLLARRPAQTLSSLNMDSSAWETALEKAADKAKTLAKTPTLASLSPKVKSVQPARVRSKDFGAGNKVFTTQARDEALARIKAASGRVNSGIDPALFKDAVIVAGHYIEGGIRQYAPLAAEMRTHFPDATEGELQRVYAAARAEAAAGITKQQRATASAALADRLAPSMGRQGVSDFLDSLSPPVLDKLLNDGKFTDAEARSLSAAYQSHVKVKTAAPPLPAIKTLRAAVRDAKAGRLGYDSAKAAVREELLKSAVSGDIKSAVRQGLLKDVPPEKQASVIAAKRKEIIAAHQKKIITALAGVKDDDFHALANVYNKFNPVSGVDKIKTVQQSSLLSGPKTLASIALAHTIGAGFEDLAVRPLAAYLSGGTVQGLNLKATGAAIKAGVRAIPEGGQMIKEGPTAMQLRGIHGGLRMEEAGGTHLHGEPVGGKMAFARAPGRVHAALYHIVGAALEERGIQEFSALKAHREGGTAASYRADPDVVKAAKEFRQEQLYQNKNKASSMIGAAANQGGPVGKVVVNTLLPFRNVPMNLAGRGLEYSGAGVPVAAARLAQAKISGQVITPELRRSLAMQAARGIAGPVAGMSAGAALTAKGVLNPSNEKSYENGSVNLGRNKYDISRLQPVSTPLLEGGELYNYLHNQELERKYGGNAATKYLVKQGEKPVDFLAPLADNPYLNVGQQIQDIHDGMSGKGKHKVEKVIGSLIGELSPTILSQIAAATDPSGNVRKKQAAWDYLMNRVPILREMLPVGKFPQSSNYKSTGLLSLLSPVNVTPHSKSGIRKLSEYKK